jgi:TonB-dependent starch-binding outer membrane protein SusC
MKKLFMNDFLLKGGKCKKILLIMRLSLILTFATLFNVTASVYSQSVKVNLDLKNATLETVFKSIQDQTEFDFFYKNEHLPQNKVITKNYKNTGVDRILDEVLEGTGLIYRVLNTDIVVTKAPPSTIGTEQEENLFLTSNKPKPLPER